VHSRWMKIQMTSFFPDLNVWLALSVAGHSHDTDAWDWLNRVPRDSKLAFARYTHIGLLRLLSNESVMGQQTLTLRKAWGVYDRWMQDPRVEFFPEPRNLETAFRDSTAPFAGSLPQNGLGIATCWPTQNALARRWSLSTGHCTT
jgi:hypothetical protein